MKDIEDDITIDNKVELLLTHSNIDEKIARIIISATYNAGRWDHYFESLVNTCKKGAQHA